MKTIQGIRCYGKIGLDSNIIINTSVIETVLPLGFSSWVKAIEWIKSYMDINPVELIAC